LNRCQPGLIRDHAGVLVVGGGSPAGPDPPCNSQPVRRRPLDDRPPDDLCAVRAALVEPAARPWLDGDGLRILDGQVLALTAEGERLREAFWRDLVEDPGPLAPLSDSSLRTFAETLAVLGVTDPPG
jgi:hypothetical protein